MIEILEKLRRLNDTNPKSDLFLIIFDDESGKLVNDNGTDFESFQDIAELNMILDDELT